MEAFAIKSWLRLVKQTAYLPCLMYRKHQTDYRDIKWILTWHYWAAFVTTQQRLHSLNVICKQVLKRQQSWARKSEKLSKSTYLVQRQHQERSAAASIYNYCNKSGVYCTKGAIPSNTGDADVVVTLIVFHRLAKHVPKFALSYHSPHCVCREEERQKEEISYGCRDLLRAPKTPAKDPLVCTITPLPATQKYSSTHYSCTFL